MSRMLSFGNGEEWECEYLLAGWTARWVRDAALMRGIAVVYGGLPTLDGPVMFVKTTTAMLRKLIPDVKQRELFLEGLEDEFYAFEPA